MSDINLRVIDGDAALGCSGDGWRFHLADHIIHQNNERAVFIHNVEFGDPLWDFLLDLFASEHFDRSTAVTDVALRIGRTIDLSQRYASYLLESGAVVENRNRFTAAKFPLLLSDETKTAICSWLDNCVQNASAI